MSQSSIMVYTEMGLLKLPLVFLLCSVFSLLSFIAPCDASELTVKFLKTPSSFSNLNSTTFVFEVLVGGSTGACTNCNITCKLDDGFGRINASQCENGTVLCEGLQDGSHKFEVCPNGTQGVGCRSYNWTVDTVPPTAYISTSTPFTSALNVSINISFSEPCTGGGFVCSPVKCNGLLVSGAGQVIPTSLKIIQRNLQYSVLVGLSSTAQSGRVTLVMDENFCTDSAGNKFTRNVNSILNVHLNRRSVNLTTHVPIRQLQFNGETRVVRATNNCNKLRICITFPVPVCNTSEEIKNALKAEILYSLQMSQGTLLPLVVTEKHQGPRRFEFMVGGFSQSNFNFSAMRIEVGSKVAACIPDRAVVNVSIDTDFIISRQRTRVSPVEPFTFLYDSLTPNVTLSALPSESARPAVMLRTPCHICTRERNIRVLIKFGKPVFGFGRSNISITGGDLQSFEEIRNGIYTVVIKAEQDNVSVNVPENVTTDVAGNKNQPSNFLQVMHYSVPKISHAVSRFTTGSFVVIVIVAGLLTVSTASLHSNGELSSSLSQSESNLFRIACYLQVIALSGWLAVRLPVEYYELTRGLRWSIPYLSLPWERETGPGRFRLVMENSSHTANTHMSKIHFSGISRGKQPTPSSITAPATSVVSKDLEFVEPQYAESVLNPSILHGWSDFGRNIFWLAIIGGGFINAHALLLLILNLKRKNSEKQKDYGALTSPRFEIVIVNFALTSICQASTALIRGGTALGIAVGVLLLGAVSFLLLALLLFLSIGITFEKLLQYEEVPQEGRDFPWIQKIVRAILVPVKEGKWKPKDKQNSNHLTILESLYKEFRGPLSQSSGDSSHTQGEDAEVPFIQKLFGKLRIYYTLLESVIQKLCGELRIYYPLLLSVKRVLLAIVAGVYEGNSSSKTPTIISLCINCFQLFFLVLEKPYVENNIHLLEIISVSSEACIFAISFVLSEKELSTKDETKFGVIMLILFLVGLLPQIMNELYTLYKEIKKLDFKKDFLTNLKRASSGLTKHLKDFLTGLKRADFKKDFLTNLKRTSSRLTKHLKDFLTGLKRASSGLTKHLKDFLTGLKRASSGLTNKLFSSKG